MMVDVYHSGIGKRVRPPFVMVPAGVIRLPAHPNGPKVEWNYWMRVPLRDIAVIPAAAEKAIRLDGYYLQ